MKSSAKHVRIAPQKANLVAGLVRNKSVTEALDILKFTPKKAAHLIAKAIASAAANAKANLKQDEKDLFIKEILVSKGGTLKRSVPISRGRVHPIKKKSSHIKVLLWVKKPTQKP